MERSMIGHLRGVSVLFVLVMFLLVVVPARAAPVGPEPTPTATPSPCDESQAFPLPGGALGLVCVPAHGWNGDVIVYAHGYVPPTVQELEFANLEIPQPSGAPPVSLPETIQSFGYAFATTTYRRNGLAVLEGVEDVRELIAAVPGKTTVEPKHIYVLGISQGGLITTLFAERYPLALDGAMAGCGPIGDFTRQIEYIGDFRVLFDYYFPAVDLPGDAGTIPAELIEQWDSVYVPKIAQALATNPISATQLISDTGAAIDRTSDQAIRTSTISTTVGLLWYNVFSTNDAKQRLGGNPYGNTDLFPGRALDRFQADQAALDALKAYQTSGKPGVPLITLHTTGDQIIPFWHQELYLAKAQQAGFHVMATPVQRYGHCSFTPNDLIPAFFSLTSQGDRLQRVFMPAVGQ